MHKLPDKGKPGWMPFYIVPISGTSAPLKLSRDYLSLDGLPQEARIKDEALEMWIREARIFHSTNIFNVSDSFYVAGNRIPFRTFDIEYYKKRISAEFYPKAKVYLQEYMGLDVELKKARSNLVKIILRDITNMDRILGGNKSKYIAFEIITSWSEDDIKKTFKIKTVPFFP